MKHIFVFDPKSFNTQIWQMDAIYKDIEEYFEKQENPDYSIVISKFRRDSIALIQKHMDEAEDGDTVRVYAIGGEEIFFDCLNSIAGLSNTELADMPFGNTNDFLRIFGDETLELFHDLQSLIQAPTIPTDIINAGNLYAINACIIGFNSAVPIKEKELRKKFGANTDGFSFFNKAVAFLGNLFTALDKRIIAQHYNLIIDDKDYSGNYCLINIANGPFYGGKNITVTGAMPNDGLLEVALFKSVGPLLSLWSMRRYSHGEVPSNCILLQAKKIILQSDELVWIQLDGEFLQDTKFTFEVIPKAIQIVVVNNMAYPKS
jgi:diacylglycerol kinase family enzyme